MKKIRYYPFGYRIVHGKEEIVPEEAAIILDFASRYLKGWSLLRLAQFAERSGIKYSDSGNGWNKNMIARILDDRRYRGDKQYPAIFSKQLGQKIDTMRERKATKQCPVQFLQKKTVCGNCGGKLIRDRRHKPRIRWECKNCNARFGPLTDKKLLEMVTKKFLTVCQNPQLAEPEILTSKNISINAARMTNEINQMLDQRQVDSARLTKLILECAAEKYRSCQVAGHSHKTLRILELLKNHAEDEKLDRNLFEQCVERVIFQDSSSVQLQFINKKTI